MFGELGDKIKGLFVKEDGSINWRTVVGIGAGAALGGFGGLSFIGGLSGVGGALAGGALGIGGATLLGMAMPDHCEPGASCDTPGGKPPATGSGMDVQTQQGLPLRTPQHGQGR